MLVGLFEITLLTTLLLLLNWIGVLLVAVAGLRAAGLRSSHLGTLIDERLGSKTLIAILGRCWQQAAKAGVAPAI